MPARMSCTMTLSKRGLAMRCFCLRFAICFVLLGIVFVSIACAAVTVTAPPPVYPREMDFGGERWRIKSSDTPMAPGPNYWSDSPESVWVDDEGLHLTIAQKDGRWYSTEVFIRRPLGYGTYTFSIDTDITNYDPAIVAGFFTWDNRPAEANREIDIEFASWGMPGGAKGHYVVQPNSGPERLDIFETNMEGTFSTHRIVWTPETLKFFSYHGEVDPDSPEARKNLMREWTFTGKPPTEGNARFRINLWLFQGKAPKTNGEKLVVRSFSFSSWEE